MGDVELSSHGDGDAKKIFDPKVNPTQQGGISKIEAPSAHTGSWEARSIRFKHWRKGTGSEGVAQEILNTIINSTDEKTLRVAFGMLNHITASQRAEFITKLHNYVKAQNLGPELMICQLFSSVLGDIKDKKLMGDIKSIGQEIADIHPEKLKTKTDKITALIEAIEKSTSSANDTSVAIRALAEAGCNVNVRIKDSKTPLHIACEKGNVAAVQALLQAGANPNIRDKEGNTPFHLACKRDDAGLVVDLLNAKADPNIRNKLGNTPFHEACEKGNIAVIKALLKKKADHNVQGQLGNTPFHRACEKGDKSVIEALIKAGAKPNIKNNANETPYTVYKSLPNQNKYTLSLLRLAGAKDVTKERKAVVLSANTSKTSQQSQRFQSLIATQGTTHFSSSNSNLLTTPFTRGLSVPQDVASNNSTTNVSSQSPHGHLSTVPESGQKEQIAERLFQFIISGDEIDEEDFKKIIENFIANGGDINATDQHGESLLNLACENGKMVAVKALIEKGAVLKLPDQHLYSHLFTTPEPSEKELIVAGRLFELVITQDEINKDNLEMAINSFKAMGGNINAKDPDGISLIDLAWKSGNAVAVQALMAAGADIQLSDKRLYKYLLDTEQPSLNELIVAALLFDLVISDEKVNEAGITRAITNFQNIGGDINVKDPDGKSLLHLACENGNIAAVKALLAAGVSLDVDNNGNTPLHLAYKEQNQEMVEYLLQVPNVNPDIKNKNGLTPPELGRMYVDTPQIDELEEALINLITHLTQSRYRSLDKIHILKIKIYESLD